MATIITYTSQVLRKNVFFTRDEIEAILCKAIFGAELAVGIDFIISASGNVTGATLAYTSSEDLPVVRQEREINIDY